MFGGVMELPEEELDAMSYGEQIARATAASLEDFVRGSADSRRQQHGHSAGQHHHALRLQRVRLPGRHQKIY